MFSWRTMATDVKITWRTASIYLANGLNDTEKSMTRVLSIWCFEPDAGIPSVQASSLQAFVSTASMSMLHHLHRYSILSFSKARALRGRALKSPTVDLRRMERRNSILKCPCTSFLATSYGLWRYRFQNQRERSLGSAWEAESGVEIHIRVTTFPCSWCYSCWGLSGNKIVLIESL